MYLREIKTIFQKELDTLYPREEIDSFFYMFMEHYLKLERFALVMQPDIMVSKDEEQPFFEGLARLRKEEPVQYIFGETDFMDLKFKVNPHVLIPRPETEGLVRWIISEFGDEKSGIKILDMGTGSGCIAIALAKAFPEAMVYAVDISKNAIEVARKNAESNQVKVQFIEADILGLELGSNLEFDLIVSNPPYVREMEKAQIENNVKRYEPQLALFVPDDEPLKFYEAIMAFSRRYLKPRGSLFFEVNQYLADQTHGLMVNNQFKDVALRKDIFGNFRMLKGIRT